MEMGTLTDMTVLPTPIDLIHAEVAIRATEDDLKDALRALAEAQRRVADLENDLARRKAWIAPVRRLTLDVLSLIFEFCGEDEWISPFRISKVSRQWRSTVLATPRAWAFLDLVEFDGEDQMIELYFQRSGNRPLHIFLPNSMPTRLLCGMERRLKCLSISGMENFAENAIFPILDHLMIRSDNANIEVSYFNEARFPSLCHLKCENYVTSSYRGSQGVLSSPFPPLQTLSLRTTNDPAWMDLLDACKSTIRSLRLKSFDFLPEEHRRVTLPAVKFLEIEYWHDELDSWPIDLTTPVLESYEECIHGIPNGLPLHRDTATVKNLKLNHTPMLASFPLLELLHLTDKSDVSAVFSQLASTGTLCPKLQQVALASEKEVRIRALDNELEEVNRHRNDPITLVFKRQLAYLPYAITDYPCGDGMPCSYEY